MASFIPPSTWPAIGLAIDELLLHGRTEPDATARVAGQIASRMLEEEATWRSVMLVSKLFYREFAPLHYRTREYVFSKVAEVRNLLSTCSELCRQNIRSIDIAIRKSEHLLEMVKTIQSYALSTQLTYLGVRYEPSTAAIHSRGRWSYPYPLLVREADGCRPLAGVQTGVLEQMNEDSGNALFKLIYDQEDCVMRKCQRVVEIKGVTTDDSEVLGLVGLQIKITRG